MGIYLENGVFNEDFNYGYPYDRVVADSAPEFEYSGSATVHGDTLRSSSYARKDFTLHYLNRSQEPRNYDKGIHSGSHRVNFFYLVFPLLEWDEIQVLTLKVHLTASGTLTFDKSFDGYHKDDFYLVINDRVHTHHDSTAGHGWTTLTTGIGRGWNTIQFVLRTAKYDPPVRRGGKSKASTKVPRLVRHLRITSINITNVDMLADGPHTPVAMTPTSTFTASAHLDAYGVATWKPRASILIGIPSNALYWKGVFTFDPQWLTDKDHGQAVITPTALWGANGAIGQFHESTDGGMELGTNGALTIKVPIDTPQTIADRTKLLHTTYWDYPSTVVIVGGKMIIPAYTHTQTSQISSLHTYYYADPVDPVSHDHQLRHRETLRWVATDVPGADDAKITTWPERNDPVGNPPWLSAYEYEPSVHPHEHFSEEGLDVTTYSRVVRMYWRTVQHMWTDLVNMPTAPHYTWQIVGIFHPFSKTHRQHILDNGFPSPKEDDAIDADEQVNLIESTAGHGGVGFWENGVMLWDNNTQHTRFMRAPVVTHRPQVLTIVYGDNTPGIWGAPGSDWVTVYQHGHNLFHRVSVDVPKSTDPHFILGRWHGQIFREHASHMSIMEIAFFDRALSTAEVYDNAHYLQGVYHFGKYR